MRLIVAFTAIVFAAQHCFAWSEGGHHLIAVIAFQQLTAEQQARVIEVLKAHPQFDDKFKIPEKAGDPEEWIIGRAAYWPDIARGSSYDRPNWHWQLGATLSIGDVNPPKTPGPLPREATLDTKELHIAQAIELCRKVLKDKTNSDADRALAICWLCHLVGDSHQPCHAGSLYCPLFPEGDRGANSIPTKQGNKMHALWDGLLGGRFDAGDIRRRAMEITADGTLWSNAQKAASDLDPLVWLKESQEFAQQFVYTEEVMSPIRAAKGDLEKIDLSERYLKHAGLIAQVRAAFAAQVVGAS